jgi:Na+/melibiose symporter-like transporter
MSSRSDTAAPSRRGTRGAPRSEDAQHKGEGESGARPLKREEKVRLALLGLPTLALALSITVVSTYLGRVTRSYTTDTILIGIIVGGEGFWALWIPMITGTWSDTLRTRLGGRLPFVLAGAVPATASLALIGFVHSLGAIAATAQVFFAGYFVAYEPYRAMYPDLVDEDAVAGRSQSAQAVARGAGTGIALLAGGLLLSIATPLPFILSALLLGMALVAFVVLLSRRGIMPGSSESSARDTAGDGPIATGHGLVRLIRRHPELRSYLAANALWEASLASLKAFVVLYMTIGLGFALSTSSLIIGGVALVILIGAAVAGKLGDRLGRLRVVTFAVSVYAIGYLVPIFTTSRPLIGAALPFIALGGGALMTLAYAVLMPLMPEGEHGALTGFYSVSRGVGILGGTVCAGVLIQVTRTGLFGSTHGFAAMWIVCSAAAFASLWFVRKLRRQAPEADRQQSGS